MPEIENIREKERQQARVQAEFAFRRRLLRGIGYTAVALVIFSFGLWFIVFRPRPPVIITLTDCTQPWSYTYKGSFFQDAALRVHVCGDIAGRAAFRVSTMPQFIAQSLPETLGPGAVNYTRSEPEWWCSSCALLYTPTEVTKGRLEITIQLH